VQNEHYRIPVVEIFTDAVATNPDNPLAFFVASWFEGHVAAPNLQLSIGDTSE